MSFPGLQYIQLQSHVLCVIQKVLILNLMVPFYITSTYQHLYVQLIIYHTVCENNSNMVHLITTTAAEKKCLALQQMQSLTPGLQVIKEAMVLYSINFLLGYFGPAYFTDYLYLCSLVFKTLSLSTWSYCKKSDRNVREETITVKKDSPRS